MKGAYFAIFCPTSRISPPNSDPNKPETAYGKWSRNIFDRVRVELEFISD
jgi:hypothetical protein